MSDRHHGYIVTLTDDIREEGSEFVVQAIQMIKYVADVQPIILGSDDLMARERVRSDVQRKLYDAIDEIFK